MGNETKTVISVECIDQTLRMTQAPTIASGGVKENAVEFTFGALWDDLILFAVFYRKPSEVYHVRIEDGRCIVPREVTRNPGYFFLGVMGAKDGVTRTSTVLSYRVEAGAITDGIEPPEPTPSIYAQILASVQSAEQIAQSVRDDADAGKFNGSKGGKGDKGDPGAPGMDGSDANVTAQNIQTALGYVPVKDVQVAGTSVMTDSVANVPIANKGGLGVSSVDDYSIGTTDAGVLFLYNSRNGDIDARSANIAVTPYNLDYAVKAAMCDGKGAAWTSAEQAAARSRMGLDKSYELIEEIVLEEEATVSRETEPDGTAYNFCAMALKAEFPAVDKSGNIPIYFRLGTLNYINSYFINPYDKNASKYGFCRCWLDGTVYRIGWWTCVHNAGEFAYYYENPLVQNKYFASNGNITSVSIGTPIPVGTKIAIYGVRA